MIDRTHSKKPSGAKRLGPIQLIAGAFALLVFLGIVLLGTNARRAIDELAVASSDSSLWSLAQTQVELGRFELALQRAATSDEPDLTAVRRHFDILYSRIQIVLRGQSLKIVRDGFDLRENIGALAAYTENTVLLIDGSDQDLIDALPTMSEDISILRTKVRELSLSGVQLHAERSRDRREAVSATLTRLAVLTVLLVVALAAGLFALAHLFRISRVEVRRSTETNRKIQSVVSASLDAIIATDQSGRIVEFNAAAETIFGHTREDAMGRHMTELIFPPLLRDVQEARFNKHRDAKRDPDQSQQRLVLEAIRKDETTFPVELSVSTSNDGTDEIVVSYLRDITEQIAAERELVQARDHAVAGERAKADLVAVMSHEMRTPLNGLLGTLDLLQSTPLNDAQRDYAQIMHRSGSNLLHHVNDVLEMSRLDAGHDDIVQKPYDPVRIALEIIEEQSEFSRKMGTVLLVDPLEQPIPPLLGDGTRVRQILLNLVGNAVKFTRDGQVSIGLDFDTERAELTVSVTDNGIGIAASNIDRIFEDFVTLDPSYARATEGSGLGLAIARRLVQAMGGEIGVESDLGSGSAFWFRIPANLAAGGDKPENQSCQWAMENNPALHILVVEDNQINRRVAREMLANLGNTVTEADNGLVGVNAAERMRFDMILMDISMPELDGVEATRRIRAGNGPNSATPIIALTAHILPTDLERFRNAGMTDAISKPISQARLGATIAAVLAAAPIPKDQDNPEPTDAVIDLSVVEELRHAIGDKTFATMRAQFLSETTEALLALKAENPEQRDLNIHADAVHKLAGSAAMFGATRLRTSLSEQEAAAQLGNRGDLQAGLDHILAVWEDTKADIARVGGEVA